jgi:hypothetical protein
MLHVAPLRELERVGLSLSVELVRAGAIVERLSVHPTSEREVWRRGLHATGLALVEDAASSAERGAWTVRVHGTNVDILESWTDTRWAGTLELPLGELLARGAGPCLR